MTPNLPNRIVLGEVVGAHGLRGEIRVRIAGDSPDHLLSAEAVWLGRRVEDPESRRYEVLDRGFARAGEVRLKIAGVNNREAAQPLVGQLATAPVTILEPLPDGEYYWYQLIGCRVESETGEVLGDVREIWETGAHDVLMVENEDGQRRLIPTAESLMREIDLSGRKIIVVDLPGLFEPI